MKVMRGNKPVFLIKIKKERQGLGREGVEKHKENVIREERK